MSEYGSTKHESAADEAKQKLEEGRGKAEDAAEESDDVRELRESAERLQGKRTEDDDDAESVGRKISDAIEDVIPGDLDKDGH